MLKCIFGSSTYAISCFQCAYMLVARYSTVFIDILSQAVMKTGPRIMMVSLHPFHIFVEVRGLQPERILKRKKRVCEREAGTVAQKNYKTSLLFGKKMHQ